MKYILTNGEQYITYERPGSSGSVASRGKVIVADDPKEAYLYETKEEAEKERKRLTKLAKGFGVEERKNKKKYKRKTFSKEVRQIVYRKTQGHCYLCGEFVDYDDFEIEHKIPLAGGGTNSIDNLFCACHMCNQMKGTISCGDMIEHAAKIATYQKMQLAGLNQ